MQCKTPEEVTKAYDVVKDVSPFSGRYFNQEQWKILFDYYNNNSGLPTLKMGCGPCYIKVAAFVKSKIKENAGTNV
jgi:hypothetical protein